MFCEQEIKAHSSYLNLWCIFKQKSVYIDVACSFVCFLACGYTLLIKKSLENKSTHKGVNYYLKGVTHKDNNKDLNHPQ